MYSLPTSRRTSLLRRPYSVLSTQYSVLRTHCSVLCSQYSVPRTRHSVLRTRYSGVDIRRPALCLLIAILVSGGCGHRPPVTPPIPADEDPRISFPTPHRSARPDAQYAGVNVSTRCHATSA